MAQFGGCRDGGWRRSAAFAALLVCGSALPATGFENAEVLAIVGNVRTAGEFPGAGGVWMGRQRVVEIDGVGNAVITEHLLARVFDPDWGRARFSPYRRTFWSRHEGVRVERARIWHSRDRWEDLSEESMRDEASIEASAEGLYHPLRDLLIDFPRATEGTVLEVKLRWECPIPRYDWNVRWLEEIFGAAEPVVEQQFTLITPQAAQLDTLVLGRPIRPRIVYRDGLRQTTWLTGHLPALGLELIETPWSRTTRPEGVLGPDVSRVVVSSLKSWSFAGTYFGAQWEDAWNRRGPEVDQIARTAMREAPDPIGRARSVERQVQESIRILPIPDLRLDMWPLPAGHVAANGAGGPRDKACLLVSALRVCGIEAVPALVRLRQDSWSEDIPSLAQLDRWFVHARIPEAEPLWLDPVGTTLPIPSGHAVLFVGKRDPEDLRARAGLVPFPGIPNRP